MFNNEAPDTAAEDRVVVVADKTTVVVDRVGLLL
jgi:hypothetical protein